MKTLLCALSLFALSAFAATGNSPSKPNIILIIADDMAWDDCGPYGNKHIQTPNLDRLAREGMRFDRAFLTASSCSPSRASILTGRYPHQTGAEQLHWPLPAEQVGFTELLRGAGYWTAAAGKWHLGEFARKKFDLVREQAAPIPPDADEQTKRRLQSENRSGCTQWVPVLRDRPKDKPFFLWLAAYDPHRDYEENIIPRPHTPSDVTVPPYLPDTPAVRKDLALYYDEISRLDRYVGDVLSELDRQGVASNTLVAFISDNGRPFPRCKTTILDSGIRTPLLVRWPANIKPAATCERLVSSIDLAPTFLSLAGVTAPTNLVGKDVSLLFTQPKRAIRDHVFAEHNWHDYEARSRAVRDERFKYIRNDYADLPNTPPADAVRSATFDEMKRLRDEGKLTPAQSVCFVEPRPREELYDLKNDPHELTNLAGNKKHAKTLARLRGALEQWGKETDDRVPAERTLDVFHRQTGERLPNVRQHRGPAPDRSFLDVYQTP